MSNQSCDNNNNYNHRHINQQHNCHQCDHYIHYIIIIILQQKETDISLSLFLSLSFSLLSVFFDNTTCTHLVSTNHHVVFSKTLWTEFTVFSKMCFSLFVCFVFFLQKADNSTLHFSAIHGSKTGVHRQQENFSDNKRVNRQQKCPSLPAREAVARISISKDQAQKTVTQRASAMSMM